jgi:hypothetical protein
MKKVIIVSISILLGNCVQKKQASPEIIEPILVKSIEKVTELDFVYGIKDLLINRDTLYIINGGTVYKGDVVLKKFIQIGKNGHGPGEYVEPNGLEVDKSIYISDSGKSSLLVFSKSGDFLAEMKLGDRFFALNPFVVADAENFAFSSPLAAPMNLYKKNLAEQSLESDSAKYMEAPENTDFVDRFYGLFRSSKYIFAISKTSNQILVFDKNGTLKSTFALPSEFFKGRFEFKLREIANDPGKLSSVFSLWSDAYIFNGELYLLIYENLGEKLEFMANTILVIGGVESGNLELKRVYKIKGEVNEQIAVNDSFLFVYNHTFGSLDQYSLD